MVIYFGKLKSQESFPIYFWGLSGYLFWEVQESSWVNISMLVSLMKKADYE